MDGAIWHGAKNQGAILQYFLNGGKTFTLGELSRFLRGLKGATVIARKGKSILGKILSQGTTDFPCPYKTYCHGTLRLTLVLWFPTYTAEGIVFWVILYP